MVKGIMVLVVMMISGQVYAAPEQNGSLRGIMQQLGLDNTNIDDAILIGDFEGAAKAAHSIAFHEAIPLPQKRRKGVYHVKSNGRHLIL